MDISKRYWVFGGVDYYPSGGMKDFLFSQNDVPDIVEISKMLSERNEGLSIWCHIFDSIEGRIFESRKWASGFVCVESRIAGID